MAEITVESNKSILVGTSVVTNSFSYQIYLFKSVLINNKLDSANGTIFSVEVDGF